MTDPSLAVGERQGDDGRRLSLADARCVPWLIAGAQRGSRRAVGARHRDSTRCRSRSSGTTEGGKDVSCSTALGSAPFQRLAHETPLRRFHPDRGPCRPLGGGLILAMLAQGLRVGVRGADSYHRSVRTQSDMEPVERALRHIIERMDPGMYPEPPLVRGSARALVFTTELPDPATGGSLTADVRLEAEDGRLVLVVDAAHAGHSVRRATAAGSRGAAGAGGRTGHQLCGERRRCRLALRLDPARLAGPCACAGGAAGGRTAVAADHRAPAAGTGRGMIRPAGKTARASGVSPC